MDDLGIDPHAIFPADLIQMDFPKSSQKFGVNKVVIHDSISGL